MSNTFQVGKTYDPREVLTLLAADVDSDEEDFDESNFIITEQENSSQDDEDECAENESLENENLHPPNSNSESILSRDGTIWENRPPNANGRTSRRNIIRTRPGTKQFILDRVLRRWMFSKNCGVTKTSNAFYGSQRLKLLGREIPHFLSLSKN